MEPILLWYETINKVSIVLDLDNISNEKIDIQENYVIINVETKDNNYNMKIKLLHPIKIEDSKYTNFRKLRLILIKQEEQMWEQLNETSQNNPKIKIDWENYTNDEENDDIEEININGDSDNSDNDSEDSYCIDENNITLDDLEVNELEDDLDIDNTEELVDNTDKLVDNSEELEINELDDSGELPGDNPVSGDSNQESDLEIESIDL